MKHAHFESLKPLCPACRVQNFDETHLRIGSVIREENDEVIEGTLRCPNPACGSVFPIIDGIPILVADLTHYLTQHAHEILWRHDLDHRLQSELGDALGPGVVYDTNRHYLSAYVDGHYRDFDTAWKEEADHPAPLSGLLDAVTAASASCAPNGPQLDLGCSVGRGTFELAAAHPDTLTLGIDLNFTMLRFARSLTAGEPRYYPRKRVGVVYDSHHIHYPPAARAKNVDFWVCDASALPLKTESFGRALSLNVLDCVPSPTTHLNELLRILTSGGQGFVATPFDWSAPVTPMNAWLGGHSETNEWHGESSAILEETLKHLRTDTGEALTVQSKVDIPWEVRIHERNRAVYQSMLLELVKERRTDAQTIGEMP